MREGTNTTNVRLVARFGLVGLVVLAVVATFLPNQPAGAQQAQNDAASMPDRVEAASDNLTELMVVGTGSRSVNYDGATGRFTVSVLSDSLIDAVSDGNTAVQAISNAVATNCTEGEPEDADHTTAPTCISPSGLQTVGIRIQEEYDWTEQGRISKGFRYENQLQISIRGTGFAGGLVDMVITAGGNSVRFESLNFTVSRRAEFERLAMLDAIDDARQTAETIADHMGYRIVRIVRLTPGSIFDPYGAQFDETLRAADSAAEDSLAAPTPVFGGTDVVTSRVQMVFELQPLLGVPSEDAPAGLASTDTTMAPATGS